MNEIQAIMLFSLRLLIAAFAVLSAYLHFVPVCDILLNTPHGSHSCVTMLQKMKE